MKAGRGEGVHLSALSPALLRAAGAFALAGAAVMVMAASGRDAGAQQSLQLAGEPAARQDSAAFSEEPMRAADDPPRPMAEPSERRLAIAASTRGEPRLDAAGAAPKDARLVAATAAGAPEITGAIDARASAPAETVLAEAPATLGTAAPADPTLENAYAPAETAAGEAAEVTALVVAPPIPQVRPETPPAKRQAAKATRATRASRPSKPAPDCGRKRPRWRYVDNVPTWYCR